MSRFQSALSYVLLALLMFTISACASASYYQDNQFYKDPISYLVGEWEGAIYIPWNNHVLPSDNRILIIYPQPTDSTLSAHYGIPGTRMQGSTTVYVEQYDGKIKITFRTGSGSTVNLWLARMGNDWVLSGTLKPVYDLPFQMRLTKRE